MKEEIITQLGKLPELINSKGKELLEKRQIYDELKLSLKTIEVITLSGIESDKDENDKPKFSNESKRKIELDNRLKINAEYQEKTVLVDNLKISINNLDLELEFCNNRFKSARAIAGLLE